MLQETTMANLWILTLFQSTQLILLALNLHSQHLQGSVHDLYPQPAENNIDWKDAVYAVDHTITGSEVVHCCHTRSKQPKGLLLATEDRTNRIWTWMRR